MKFVVYRVETVNGVQRIRGLAGSGKTIVLARKVAYLHAKNPDWKIAVTFNTRSLKKQFENLITSFVYEQTNELPNFEKIKIIHAWGSPSMEGVYYNAALSTNSKYFDFRSAKNYRKSTDQNEFDFACKALLDHQHSFSPLYDLILIDEAQDFTHRSVDLDSWHKGCDPTSNNSIFSIFCLYCEAITRKYSRSSAI